MQEFTTTSPGVAQTPIVIWTGDVEFRSACIWIVCFSCCRYGVTITYTHTPVYGGSSAAYSDEWCATTNCYQNDTRIDIVMFTGTRRLTKLEYNITLANLCPKDTPVKFKLAFDVNLSSSNGCDPPPWDSVQII